MTEDDFHSEEFLEEFLRGSFDISVRFERRGFLDMGDDALFIVAIYQDPSGQIIGALAMEYVVALSVAAAQDNIPFNIVEEASENGEIPDRLIENCRSFLSVSSGLISPEAKLFAFYESPKNIPPALYEFLLHQYEDLSSLIPTNENYLAVVRTYGEGQMVLFLDVFEERTTTDGLFSTVEEVEEEEVDISYLLIEDEEIDFENVGRSKGPLWMVVAAVAALLIWWFWPQEVQESIGETITETIEYDPIIPVDSVLIKVDSFNMGCPTDKKNCPEDEPLHSVKLNRSFYMMTSEVTQDLYARLTKKRPSHFWKCGEKCPVEDISWLDAVVFANHLSRDHRLQECYLIEEENVVRWPKKQQCEGWRLPTEAEWEYAARGTDGSDEESNAPGALSTVAWFKEVRQTKRSGEDGWYGSEPTLEGLNEQKGPYAVCRKQKNDFGLCDMRGNVWEWTWDAYDPDFYIRLAASKNPVGSRIGNQRVLRGGSWALGENYSTVHHRSALPLFASNGKDKKKSEESIRIERGSVGFRLVRTVIIKR